MDAVARRVAAPTLRPAWGSALLSRRWVTTTLLATGVAAAVPELWLSSGADPLATQLGWGLASTLPVGAAALVRWRRPDHPLLGWLALLAAATPLSFLLGMITRALAITTDPSAVAASCAVAAHPLCRVFGDVTATPVAVIWSHFLEGTVAAVGSIAAIHLIGMFPDGQPRSRLEAAVLRGSWALSLVPAVVLVATPTVVLPPWAGAPAVPNPLHLGVVSLDPTVLVASSQAAIGVGVALLVVRYRWLGAAERQRVRWLLLPAGAIALTVGTNATIGVPNPLLSVLMIASLLSLYVAIPAALLASSRVDVDRLLRGTLVYGVLWLLITVLYVLAGAAVGITAGRTLTIGWAAVVTVVGALAFQPARRALEGAADRWVFGGERDPASLVARLGARLEDTYDLDRVLPEMAATLEEGLGLRWARVRLSTADERNDGHADGEPALTVPIVLQGQQLGSVECGPKVVGGLSDADEAVVRALAQQAALAVRNVRLTADLADHAADLAASRARLVQAQEQERRRIERNIHDGVQQDLVAMVGIAGRLRHAGGAVATDDLDDLHEGLKRVLGELRDLARGIHPALLSDDGLVAAMEALAARNPVPVTVRADDAARGLRLPEEVEGAGYFTVAEALANCLKHAAATHVDITVELIDGALRIQVRDDGVGFAATRPVGNGLGNIAERLAALGGDLDVTSEPHGGTTVTARLALPSEPGAS